MKNHLLQMVALLAIEPLVSEDPDALRDAPLKVLRGVEPLNIDSPKFGSWPIGPV